MIKSKKQMFMVITSFILIMLLTTVTYAFFNYTRTGVANRIQVGRIYFNSEQGNSINLTNVFPIDKTTINSDTDNVGSVSIHITGDTTYSEGVEYLVTAVDVNNTIGTGSNAKNIPISVDISYDETTNKTIGESDKDYFDNRGGNTSIYKKLAGKSIAEGNKLLVGYIAPNQTGIDGNITIKAYLDKDKVAISDTYSTADGNYNLTLNTRMTSDELTECINFFSNEYSYYLQTGESMENFCNGTGTLYGKSFDYILYDWLESSDRDILKRKNVLVDDSYGTTDNWVNERVVLSSSMWNSLHDTGLSFKIKVEANEGIWVDRQGNAMNSFPTELFNYSFNYSYDVKEIYFESMDSNEMHQRYDAATIKADITYNNEGEVLCWLETNLEDNTKYTMYVVSDGETFLTKLKYLFYDANIIYPEKIVFNNVNTSRITDMSSVFYFQRNLKEVDIRDFDTSNVTNMNFMFYGCDELTSVNMEGLDLRKVMTMSSMFYDNKKLTEINLDNTETRDIQNMSNMFYQSDNIETINLENFGGDNLQTISSIFGATSSGRKTTEINMKNFNFGVVSDLQALFLNQENLELLNLTGAHGGNFTNADSMFGKCKKLTTIDLSTMDFSNVYNMNYMFENNLLLSTIYVSNDWNVDNVTNSYNMFNNCSSLVGGNGTTYDSSKIDKTMAVIDNNDHEGYFTLKTN